MKRIPWFDIALRCRDCGRTTYRPARGDRRCRWCCKCSADDCSCSPSLEMPR